MKKIDKVFHNSEETPEIKSCIMHPHLPVELKVRDESDNGLFQGINYGLCKSCAEESKINPTFQKVIDLELQDRLRVLRQTLTH
jgi:hypothetical protein